MPQNSAADRKVRGVAAIGAVDADQFTQYLWVMRQLTGRRSLHVDTAGWYLTRLPYFRSSRRVSTRPLLLARLIAASRERPVADALMEPQNAKPPLDVAKAVPQIVTVINSVRLIIERAPCVGRCFTVYAMP